MKSNILLPRPERTGDFRDLNLNRASQPSTMWEGEQMEIGFKRIELKEERIGGRAMNIIKRIKRVWYRLCNSDPVYNCPVYKNEGCAYVDGPLCVPSDCEIVHKYLGHRWIGCVACQFNDECCSKHYGLGCYNGSIKYNKQ